MSSIKGYIRRCLIFLIQKTVCVLGKKNRQRLIRIICQALSLKHEDIHIVTTDYGNLKFNILNDLTEWRTNTFFTKEPETIEWIDSFDNEGVFWDIGANVGIYSIYAAKKGLKVLSFEPESSNYYLLNRNIRINFLHESIHSLCVALNDKNKVGELAMQMIEIGGSMSSFDEAYDYKEDKFEPVYKQGVIGISIDNFIKDYQPLFPNYIKIDVDGNEDKIIQGANETLRDKRLKSISIELNDDRKIVTENIIKSIESCGMSFKCKKNSKMFTDTKFSNMYNYQFERLSENKI